MKRLFITTPIYYSSGKPHVGHAYTTILADVIARYKKVIGYDVFFQTGMDEHGQKIQDTAKKNNKLVQDMLDETATMFQDLWKALDIDYDNFIRTTNPIHEEVVQKTFSDLLAKGYIYEGLWEGYYCVSCEENYSKDQAIEKDGKFYCKVGHELTYKQEQSYFLKMSQFSDWIKNQLQVKDFVVPTSRVNELTNSFLTKGLEDLSVTRTTFDWGIPVKENPKHVIYVWIDALMNYLSGLGYLTKNDANYKKYWADKNCQVIHLMSKEITRFHCIYWPIMLYMLGLRLPSQIVSHGWVVTKEGKMSKSLGNVIDPYDYINAFGSDAFRYYIIRQVNLEKDGIFSYDLFIETFNSQLANNYGNMATRTAGMLKKYFGNVVPQADAKQYDELDKALLKSHKEFLANYENKIEKLDINGLLDDIQDQYNLLNKYIDDKKPWVLAKEEANKQNLANTLNNVFNCAINLIILLKPILVKTSVQIENAFNLKLTTENLQKDWAGQKIADLSPLFVRIAKQN